MYILQIVNMILTATTQKFVLHWGEMGNRWGINRTVAQVHALLYISPEPLDAEEITRILGVARSNVSTSLRELQAWGVVKVVHVMGKRREHFVSVQDVWQLFQIILDERKRREIDPTLALLKTCVQEAKEQDDPHVQTQLSTLLTFFETMDKWYQNIRKMPMPLIIKFLKVGDKLTALLKRKDLE